MAKITFTLPGVLISDFEMDFAEITLEDVKTLCSYYGYSGTNYLEFLSKKLFANVIEHQKKAVTSVLIKPIEDSSRDDIEKRFKKDELQIASPIPRIRNDNITP